MSDPLPHKFTDLTDDSTYHEILRAEEAGYHVNALNLVAYKFEKQDPTRPLASYLIGKQYWHLDDLKSADVHLRYCVEKLERYAGPLENEWANWRGDNDEEDDVAITVWVDMANETLTVAKDTASILCQVLIAQKRLDELWRVYSSITRSIRESMFSDGFLWDFAHFHLNNGRYGKALVMLEQYVQSGFIEPTIEEIDTLLSCMEMRKQVLIKYKDETDVKALREQE